MGQQNKIEVVLALMDKATAPFVSFNKRLESMQAPVAKLNNKLALFSKAGGMDKLTEAAGGVATAFGGVASEVGALATKVAAGVGIIGGSLFALVKMTANAADGFDEMSTKAGVSSKFFQQAAYAASFASVEQGALANAMGKMNQNIVAANTGGKEMQIWFKRAGINAAELKKMKPEEVFSRVIAKVKELPKDSAKAGALMKAIFGKSGGDLLPMVESFQELSQEAVDLGLILSDDTVKAGAEFNDSFDKTMKVIKGVGMMIGGMLMPYFQQATEAITNFVMKNRELIKTKVQEWIDRAVAAWPAFKQGVLDAWAAITQFVSGVVKLVEKLGGLGTVLKLVALVMAGPLLMAIASLGQALYALGVAIMTTPFGWIIAAIAGVIAVAALLWANFESLGESTQAVFGFVGEVFGTLLSTIGELAAFLAPVVLPLLKAIGAVFGGVIVVAVMALVGALKVLMFVLDPIVSALAKVFEVGGKVIGWITGGSAAPAAAGGAQTPSAGFSMGPPAGFEPAAANRLGSGFAGMTQTNNAKVEVDFKNVPKGVNVTPMGGTAPLDLSMGYANTTF